MTVACCGMCGERVAWVADARQWRHIDTGMVKCHPRCATCGIRPASHGIGRDRFIGSGIRFVVDEWRCEAHIPVGMLVRL